MRILTHDDVVASLTPAECAAAMEDVLAALARGELHNPLRSVVRPPNATGLMGLMPAHRSGASPLYSLKAVCVMPDNPTRGLDAHQGVVLLSTGDTGELTAIVDASAITGIRTAAVSAVATKALARSDARTLAVIGAGTQAITHLDALAVGMRPKRIVLWARRPEQARELAERYGTSLGVAIEIAESIRAAVAEADVICTTTSAREPIIERGWLRDGTHINAVGSSIPTTRELDSATMRDAALFVDRRESTLNESGDFRFAQADGAVTPESIRAELGEVLAGQAEGRRDDREITVFKSLGIAVEDLAASELAVRNAEAAGRGTVVAW